MTKQTGKKPFSCSNCKRTFRWSSQFKTHSCTGEALQRDRSLEKKDGCCSCSICGETFSRRTVLRAHKKSHQQVFTCSGCRMQFRFFSQLKVHMRKHTGEKPYSCPICGKKFSQLGVTKQHILIHSKVKPFSCTACGKTFSWQFQIKRHKCVSMSEPIKNLGSERSLNLSVCRKPEVSLEGEDSDSDFWRETRHHHSGVTYQRNKKDFSSVKEHNNKKPLNHRDKKTNGSKNDKDGDNNSCKQSSLNNEIKDTMVSDAQKELLTFPETSTGSQKSHTMKIRVRDRLKENPFSCPHCGKRFVSGVNLTRHVCTHKGEKHLSSTDWETFPFESELLRHECQQGSLQHHRTEKQMTSNGRFSCPYFDKKFVLKEQLQIHMRRHTLMNRLRCLLCGETFATQEDLTFHLERHVRCSVCNAVFEDRDSLVQHMRSHTGQTQFCCSVCGKDFEWRRQLTRHMQVHEATDGSRAWIDSVNHQDSTWKRVPRKTDLLEENGVYICRVCQRGFSCQSDLSHHECVNQIHFSQTQNGEENKQTVVEDSEGPEPTRKSKPDGALLLKVEDKALESSDPDTDDSDFWKETKIYQSSDKSLKRKVFESNKGFNFKEVKPQSDVSDFWKQTKVFDSDLTSEVRNDISPKKENIDIQQVSSRDLSQHKKIHIEIQHEVKEEQPEPPQIKEEQQEAEVSEFTFSPVSVKTEDDEEKPQSLQLYDTFTEENRDSVGRSESGKNTDLDFRAVYVKTEDSVDRDFWKDASLNSETDSCDNPVSGSDDKAPDYLHPESDDSVDSDFWKGNRKSLPLLNTNDPEASQEHSQKPYRCRECGKRFAHISHMNTHMQQHTEKRHILCSICGQEYPYKSLWQIHMRTHTGEKPFGCPVCGKKYAHKATMQSHMIIHTVENQYSCEICGKSFAWYTELKYHQCVREITRE